MLSQSILMKQSTWSKSTAFYALILLIFLLSFVVLISNYQFLPNGDFVKRPSCYDTDNGKDFSRKGFLLIYNETENSVQRIAKEDSCQEGKLIEYFCNSTSSDMYSSQIIDCNCQDGRCK